MKFDGYILLFMCIAIFGIYLIKKPYSAETFINACQYHNQQFPIFGYDNQLKPQVGTAGLDIMHDNINDIQKRASWIRNPEPRYKYQCGFDKNANKKCEWKQIYNTFYPDLRGEQKNMISP
jgi:hypothetical protein